MQFGHKSRFQQIFPSKRAIIEVCLLLNFTLITLPIKSTIKRYWLLEAAEIVLH